MTIKTNERIIVETMNSGAWDEARVANLENLINEYEVFYSVASGTSGTVPIYTGATLVLAQYGGLNGLVVNLDANGKPTDSLAKTSGGANITVVINGAGNYTLSGASITYPVAIVYQLAITQKLAGNIPLSNVVDYTVVHGTLSYQDANNVAITGGSITNITDLAIADGGTGASTAAGARTNLGVTATGADTTYAFRANNLSDLANAATARTNLGLGTAAVSNTGDFTPASHVGSGGTQHANATTSVAGFMSATDKTKLDGVAAGATANQTNAFLLSRANHTGTQPLSTISDAGTMASQNANAVAITGGAINNTPIGGVTPSTGSFTSVGATSLQVTSPAGQNAYVNYLQTTVQGWSAGQKASANFAINNGLNFAGSDIITATIAGNALFGKTTDDTFAKIQSSNGITLGNTANANPTVLDWYEEGTFTPAVAGGTTSGTATYAAQLGKYTRAGNKVTAEIYIIYSGHTGTGGMRITGLPFTNGSLSSSATISLAGVAIGADNYLNAYCFTGTSQILVETANTLTGAAAELPVPANIGFIVLTIEYLI